MTLTELNALPRYRAEGELIKCCGSTAWTRGMAGRRPFVSFERLLKAASEVWWRLDQADWMEAFRAHPQIGARKGGVQASTQFHVWSAHEQSGMDRAGVAVAGALEEGNREYLAKFGYIFIVCATGKSADDMLALLQSRLLNPPEEEIRVAAAEQNKITCLRLEKLLVG
jgi:2-oxo-4-hydroxy-4-carboxy-5-ureidoimidazoline decarboxylase